MTASRAASPSSRMSRRASSRRRDQRGAAGLAGEDPLLPRDSAGHRERVPVRDAHPPIDDRRVVGAREEVLADALGQVRAGRVAGEHGALRVRADDHEVGLLRLQVARRAGDRAARADARDEVRDPALRLSPDLRPGRLLVGRRVLLVPVLVGLEGARDVAREPGRDRVVALGRLGLDVRGAQDDLRAVGPEQRLLLGRLLVGHHEDAAVALERGGDREAVPGVARTWAR